MERTKINILIVEDEAIVALDLATSLEKDGYRVVGTADHFEEAIQLFSQHEVDIVLMDIHLAGAKDGVETVQELMQIRQVPVIYLTAFTDAATVERVKQTFPAAFLTKPYNVSNVRIAIELALNHFAVVRSQQERGRVVPLPAAGEKKEGGAAGAGAGGAGGGKETILQLNDCIFIKHNYQFIKIRLDDIRYVEADGNHVHVITEERKFVVRLSLNQLFEKLLLKKLVRIHRSYAVNIEAIQSFNDMQVVIGRQELPIGRNYKEDFLRRFEFR